MAKPTFSKLKLSVNTEEKDFTWEDQVIKVKQYLPIQEKLEFVSSIINESADENRFYNRGKADIFFALNLLYYYTNITFTDKQKEDPTKLYDMIKSSGFLDVITAEIPGDEIDYLYEVTLSTIRLVYEYQNSVYGIMDALSTDYNNLDFDIEKLKNSLQNKENVEFLNNVLTKMG